MKVAIYNPYLDTLGGGERYTMAIARVLVNEGYKVCVQWSDPSIKNKLEERFGVNLEGVEFVEDIKRGDGYDICFWVSDGSIPLLYARKNFLHFQVPFHDTNNSSLINKIKFFRIKKVICNSHFTKNVIDQEYGVDSAVLYPPVDVGKIKPKKKEKLVLSVGRFSKLLQSKRPDVLIEAFKRFADLQGKSWTFVLAGGVEVGAENQVEELETLCRGYNVKILKSPSFSEIKSLYGRASFYWTAAGFDIDEKQLPEKVEHFGITVVEAMSAGCIPLAYDAGGHKEIVESGINGYLWRTKSDLIQKTTQMIENKREAREIIKNAVFASKRYSYEEFEKNFLLLL